MRLVLLSLVVAALTVPAAGLADGSSAGRSGSPETAKIGVKKTPKRATKASAKRAQVRAARLKSGTPPATSKPSAGSSSSSAGEVEIKGAVTAIDAAGITVGTRRCALPTGMALTGVAVGDVVELKCRLVAGAWTVAKVEREDGVRGDQQGEAKAKGPVTALSARSITVGPLTCVVPAGRSLGSLAVGDVVEVECLGVGGTWTLKEVEREDDDSGPSGSDDDHDDDHSGSGSGDDD